MSNKRAFAIAAAILSLVLIAPVSAGATTSGDVSFDLDPTNVPSCASAITVPNSQVTASVGFTDYYQNEQLWFTDNTYDEQPIWRSDFISDEFDISWQVNNCWGPNPGGWLDEADGFMAVTKTKTSNSTTSNLGWNPTGADGVANENLVWLDDADAYVKLGGQTQWTDLNQLHPENNTSLASENTYRMRMELSLRSNYEGYLEDSTYVATATFELWEGGY